MNSVKKIDHTTNDVYLNYDQPVDRLGRMCNYYPVFLSSDFSVEVTDSGVLRKMDKLTFINKCSGLLSKLVDHFIAMLINVQPTDMLHDKCCVPTNEELLEESRGKPKRTPTAVAIEKLRFEVSGWTPPSPPENIEFNPQLDNCLLQYAVEVVNGALKNALKDLYQDDGTPAFVAILSYTEWDLLHSIRNLPTPDESPPLPNLPPPPLPCILPPSLPEDTVEK